MLLIPGIGVLMFPTNVPVIAPQQRVQPLHTCNKKRQICAPKLQNLDNMVLNWIRSLNLPWVLPWQKNMTYDPIDKFVKQPDSVIRRTLAREWRDAKLAELNYVGITVNAHSAIGKMCFANIEHRAL